MAECIYRYKIQKRDIKNPQQRYKISRQESGSNVARSEINSYSIKQAKTLSVIQKGKQSPYTRQ